MNHQARWSRTAPVRLLPSLMVRRHANWRNWEIVDANHAPEDCHAVDGQVYRTEAEAEAARVRLNAEGGWPSIAPYGLTEEQARHIDQMDVEAADLRCEEEV